MLTARPVSGLSAPITTRHFPSVSGPALVPWPTWWKHGPPRIGLADVPVTVPSSKLTSSFGVVVITGGWHHAPVLAPAMSLEAVTPLTAHACPYRLTA